jgi:hypothetical protein
VQEMTRFHSDEYIDFLYRVTPENVQNFPKHQQKFNVGEDCPVFDGIFEYSALSSGGSLGTLIPHPWMFLPVPIRFLWSRTDLIVIRLRSTT